MAFKGREQVIINPDKLRGVLVDSGLHTDNPALNQVMNGILDSSGQLQTSLGNKLDKDGKIDATKQIQGTVPIANGGTKTGIYTPEITLVANVAGAGVDPTIFYQVGKYISVSGKIQATPIAFNTLTRVALSLPLISYFNFDYQLSGFAVCPTVRNECAALYADVVNNRAIMEWLSGYNGVPQNFFYQFTYRIVQQ